MKHTWWISGHRECRRVISEYRALEAIVPSLDDPSALTEVIIDDKRAVRAYLHREDDRRVIQWDYDGCVMRIEVPQGVETVEEAEAWFDATERLTCRPSQYDCTGQKFTVWHRIITLGGRLVCYHCVGIDV